MFLFNSQWWIFFFFERKLVILKVVEKTKENELPFLLWGFDSGFVLLCHWQFRLLFAFTINGANLKFCFQFNWNPFNYIYKPRAFSVISTSRSRFGTLDSGNNLIATSKFAPLVKYFLNILIAFKKLYFSYFWILGHSTQSRWNNVVNGF